LLEVFFFAADDLVDVDVDEELEVDEDELAAWGRGEPIASACGAEVEMTNAESANARIAVFAGAALICLLSPNPESPQAGPSARRAN